VRELIVGGLADPQDTSDPEQAKQYLTSVRASWTLARTFLDSGYDVAIEIVFEPDDFRQNWEPLLAGYDFRVVILHPTLETALERSRSRAKRVMERHTRSQHAACALWSDDVRIDTTDLDIEETLALLCSRL
jgi:chloramphenicol 3-O-phosphotransferase